MGEPRPSYECAQEDSSSSSFPPQEYFKEEGTSPLQLLLSLGSSEGVARIANAKSSI